MGLLCYPQTDWALDVAGVPYSHAVGLRHTPKTSSGKIPKTQIKPTAIEILAGIRAIALAVLKEHRNDNLRNLNTGCRCQSNSSARY